MKKKIYSDKEELNKNEEFNSLQKKNPFSVHSNYFDKTKELILSETRLKEQIQSDNNLFYTPDNYFEQLSKCIIKRTIHSEKQASRYSIIGRWLYVAAATFALILSSYPIFKEKAIHQESTFSSINNEELNELVQQNIEYVPIEDILDDTHSALSFIPSEFIIDEQTLMQYDFSAEDWSSF